MDSGYTIVVTDNEVLSGVCGSNDSNLRLIEEYLGVPVFIRGNELTVASSDEEIYRRFQTVIDRIASGVLDGGDPSAGMLHSILHDFHGDESPSEAEKPLYIQIPGSHKRVYPKTAGQAEYMRRMPEYDVCFCVGPAGSGKTFLSVACALREVLSRRKRKLILTRPVVEAGESLGFLPGDVEQKINPYLRPLFDSIEALVSSETLRRMEESGMLEIAPLAYMRGRTLTDCVVILDEAQNTTREQMKMFLTRMGEGSRMLITGDITQTDLPKRTLSGLTDAMRVLEPVEDILIMRLAAADVVRNPLVKKIVQAYEHDEQNQY